MSQADSNYTQVRTNAVGGQYHFLLRRLHSLTGIVPIGIFVMFHLFTNMQIVFGTFQHEVEWIHSQPALIFMEIFVLALPITFHAVLGFIYTFKNVKPNASKYSYWDNWRYTLQRVTGIIAFIFIVLHVFTLRGRFNMWGWHTPFFVNAELNGEVVDLATTSTALAVQTSWLVLLIYIIGVLAVIYHWSNGLWTAAITWGVTISDKAQKRWAWMCGGLFAALFVFSALALWGSWTYVPTAEELEAYNAGLEAVKNGTPGVFNVPH